MHVILECFGGCVDTYDAFISSEGIIDAWLPFIGARTSPGENVLVDSQDYLICRMSFFTSEFFGHDICLWPFVQVDVHLRINCRYSVVLHYTISSYRVEVETSPDDQFLLEDQILDIVELVDISPGPNYEPEDTQDASPYRREDSDIIAMFEPDADINPTPKRRGRPKKTSTTAGSKRVTK